MSLTKVKNKDVTSFVMTLQNDEMTKKEFFDVLHSMQKRYSFLGRIDHAGEISRLIHFRFIHV